MPRFAIMFIVYDRYFSYIIKVRLKYNILLYVFRFRVESETHNIIISLTLDDFVFYFM